MRFTGHVHVRTQKVLFFLRHVHLKEGHAKRGRIAQKMGGDITCGADPDRFSKVPKLAPASVALIVICLLKCKIWF